MRILNEIITDEFKKDNCLCPISFYVYLGIQPYIEYYDYSLLNNALVAFRINLLMLSAKCLTQRH